MYYPKLDSIRCFAAFAVVFAHIFQIWTWDPATVVLFPLGNAGVVVFFVLSGFLITKLLLEEPAATPLGASLKNFYMRRALRIFPIYYLYLFAAYAVNLEDIRAAGAWPWVYLTNFFIFQNDQWLGTNSPLWSLAMEEQFYLVWPFVVLFLRGKAAALAAVFAGVCVLGMGVRWFLFAGGYSASPQIEVFTFANVDYLSLGALLALAHLRCGARLAKYGLPALAGGLAAYYLSAQLTGGPAEAAYWTLGKFSVALAAAGWIVHSLHSPQKYTPLHNPATIRLGVISYAVYLFHNPIVSNYREISGFFGLNPAAGVDYNPATNMISDLSAPLPPRLLAAAVCLIMVVIVAECSYRFIERPFLRAKDRFRGAA